MPAVHHNSRLELDVGPPNVAHAPMLASAREVYQTYCQSHVHALEEPLGVAVDQRTFRSQLIFADQPILLPYESFIPIADLSAPAGIASESSYAEAVAAEAISSGFTM